MTVIFTVRLRAPAGQAGVHALRRALKFAGRYCELHCIDVVEQHQDNSSKPDVISPRG